MTINTEVSERLIAHLPKEERMEAAASQMGHMDEYERGAFEFRWLTEDLLNEPKRRGEEPPVIFYTGSEKLNPVPCFAVAKLAPGLVGGFVGGVVHT